MAEDSPYVPLGPWPFGINNVDELQSSPFQPGEQGAQLRTATNVDIDRGGYLKRRKGRTKKLELTDGRALFAVDRRLAVVDAGDLILVDPNGWFAETLISELPDEPFVFTEYGGSLWWLCGDQRGRFENTALTTWGLPTPFLLNTQSTPYGSLPAGRYLVTATIERNNLESGAPHPSLVELHEPGGIELFLGAVPLDATVNLYCSDPDGTLVYFARQVLAGAPYIIEQRPTTEPLDLMGAYPPPAGQVLVGFSGRLLIGAGNLLYWSLPGAYHHWRIGLDVQLFPDRITMIAPLEEGFYVGTEREVYWIGGNDPENWEPRRVDTQPAFEGSSLRLDGRKFPGLEFPGAVQCWMSTDGLAAGMPDGMTRHFTHGRLSIKPHQKASLAYREEEGVRQVLAALQNQKSANPFGASDRATCRIIRGIPSPLVAAAEPLTVSDTASCQIT